MIIQLQQETIYWAKYRIDHYIFDSTTLVTINMFNFELDKWQPYGLHPDGKKLIHHLTDANDEVLAKDHPKGIYYLCK